MVVYTTPQFLKSIMKTKMFGKFSPALFLNQFAFQHIHVMGMKCFRLEGQQHEYHIVY